mmetsp:Transcript_6632/g.9562  ORF Transcript_6632/g.9562 Transcript_6632/m.9562 type:complete len:185 (-) Transcript_6632:245-799(-)
MLGYKKKKEKVNLIGAVGGTRKSEDGLNGKEGGKTRTPGEIRIQKDIADVEESKVAQLKFDDPDDLTTFRVTITPDDGFWKGATYPFLFKIPPHYPHSPPKVTCEKKIFHPNINLEGNVCLNILREDWKPVLDINNVIFGLIHLFSEPNPDDPLNKEAAELFRRDLHQFKAHVQRTLKGGTTYY